MKAQALGWLMAGVVAAGLNASYHDGRLEWMHQAVEQLTHSTGAVLALASGHVNEFLAEARLVTAGTETGSCPWSRAWARVQGRTDGTDRAIAQFDRMSARQQVERARLEAMRTRIEAQVMQQRARWQGAAARFDSTDIDSADFDPSNFVRFDSIAIDPADFTVNVPDCPRVRVHAPRPPNVHVHVPPVHVEINGAGPV